MLSDIDSANNLVELFLKRADEKGDLPFLGVKLGGAPPLSLRHTLCGPRKPRIAGEPARLPLGRLLALMAEMLPPPSQYPLHLHL